MKKLLFAIMALMVTSCSLEPNTHEVRNDNKRFQVVYNQPMGLDYIEILIDKETGVKYLFYKQWYGSVLTKLEEDEKESN